MVKSSGMTIFTRSSDAIDGGGRFDVVLHAFEGDPGAAEAAHGIAVEAVIEDLLNARRVQDRHHHVDEVELGLMRDGGGFGRVVVAHERQHAAVLRGAGHVGVAEDVAGAVDARALAVPEAEDAVILAVAAHLGLLRAPDGGRGELLVEAGLEDDVGGRRAISGRARDSGRGRRSGSRDSRRRNRPCSGPPAGRARAASAACG